jgi:hypothetical protein
MADIIRHPGWDPHFQQKLSYACVARDMRNWRLRMALRHLDEAIELNRVLSDEAEQVRGLELAARQVRRYRQPRLLNLFEPKQLDLFEETG